MAKKQIKTILSKCRDCPHFTFLYAQVGGRTGRDDDKVACACRYKNEWIFIDNIPGNVILSSSMIQDWCPLENESEDTT